MIYPPSVRHISREDAEAFTWNQPYVVISITDPGTPFARLCETPPCLAILRVVCHDIDAIPEGIDVSTLRIYGPEEARRVAAFVDMWMGSVALFLCHCEAGLSRSAAIAAAVAVRVCSLAFPPRKGIPNRRVYLETIRQWQ